MIETPDGAGAAGSPVEDLALQDLVQRILEEREVPEGRYHSLPAGDLSAAETEYLKRLQPEALGWTELWSERRQRPYYFSNITCEVQWKRPFEFSGRLEQERFLTGAVEHLRAAVSVCEEYGIQLEVLKPGVGGGTPHLLDPVYGNRIQGHPPSLRDLLFYGPILSHALRLYPKSLVRVSGLRRIIFLSGLTYKHQTRRLIPVLEGDYGGEEHYVSCPTVFRPRYSDWFFDFMMIFCMCGLQSQTATLYIDPGPLPVYYLQGEFIDSFLGKHFYHSHDMIVCFLICIFLSFFVLERHLPS